VDRGLEIAALGATARAAFEEKHRAREVTITASRQAIQACAASIRSTHRGEFDAAELLAREARDHLAAADVAVSAQADVRTGGPLNDAKKELAEAWLTLALVRDLPLPSPENLGIEIAPYCNGLAEAASELRRQLLDQLRAGELARAETLMRAMDEIYALRAVLERTRGDLTTAIVASRLQAAIESAQRSTGA
jgi:translin